MAWFPHYEEYLIIPTDNSLSVGLRRETALSWGNNRIAGELPIGFNVWTGDIDCPIFHLRPRAQRNAQMAPIESQNYRGLLERSGVKF
jgi:hypothetical protein